MPRGHPIEVVLVFFDLLADPPPVVLEDRFELLVGGQGLRVVASMASSRRWRAACRQFDSCAGSGGQARRRRERGGRGEREEELHLSSLALGNAYVCRLAAATTDVRVRLAASEHCDVVCAPRAAGEHEFRLRCDASVLNGLLLPVPCLQSIPGPRTARRASTPGRAASAKKGVGFGPHRLRVVGFARLRYCVLTDGCKNVASGL